MNSQVMLDLETLGKKPGSVITTIGAVKFGHGQILDSFYERIDPESCVAAGLAVDVSTVLWWLTQGDDARKEITQPGKPLHDVLVAFSVWLDDPSCEVWGNGADFDNVMLSDAYDRVGVPCPWKFYNNRCYRTVRKLRPDITLERTGTHHNALDDAKTQAIHLMKVMDAINPAPAPAPAAPSPNAVHPAPSPAAAPTAPIIA